MAEADIMCANARAFEADDEIELQTVTPQIHVEPDTSSNVSQPVRSGPSGVKNVSTVVAAAFALWLEAFDSKAPATAVPSITTTFHTSTGLGWYAAAYLLAGAGCQFIFGRAYSLSAASIASGNAHKNDTFTTKGIMIFSLVVLAIGSAICAAAPSPAVLIFGRAMAGMGSAGVISGIFAIMALSVPLAKRPKYMAWASAFEGVAESSAPLLGGALSQTIGWRWIFGLCAPFGVACVLVLWWCYDERAETEQEERCEAARGASETRKIGLGSELRRLWRKLAQLDLIGTAVFVPAVTLLLLALQFGGDTYGWRDARVAALLAVSVLLTAVFVWYQKRQGEAATIPPRIVKRRSVWGGAWFAMCNTGTIAVVEYYMPIYLQTALERSPLQSGYLILPITIGMAMGILVSGALISRTGYPSPSMIGTSILSPVAAGLLTTLPSTSASSRLPLARILGFQVLVGFATGIGFQGPAMASQGVLSPADAAVGIAIVQFAQKLGPVIAIPMGQIIFQETLAKEFTKIAFEGSRSGNTTAHNIGQTSFGDLKQTVPPEDLEMVLRCYGSAISRVYVLAIGLACATLLGSIVMEWRSVKEKKS